MTDFAALADAVLAGTPATEADALAVLRSTDAELLDVVGAASRLRRHHFSNTVKVNYLVNLKSGLCPEDCGYCSQRLNSTADILKYSWLKGDEAVEQAGAGLRGGASRVCLVSSGRGPSNRDIDRVTDIVGTLKDEYPDVEVCACLGLLKEGQAERLAEAGVDAYNHNINTAESNYEGIVSTHTYEDRVDTVNKAKGAGLSPCSGLIAGMGETDEQLVEALFALRDMESDSIPVNFLMPFEGTPLTGMWELTPQRCVRILAMARFVCPDREIRIAGGREMHLRTLQGLALHVANSIFLGDYLTSEGQAAEDDIALIRDNGFVILGHEDMSAFEHTGAHTCAGDHACGGAGGCDDGGCDDGGCGGEGACGGHEHAAGHAAEHGRAGRHGDVHGNGLGPGEAAPSEVTGAPAGASANAGANAGDTADHNPTIRRRGAGTSVPANA